ncbi:MAG: cell envelope integrity protein TolA [Deltaproteobacteria bacterium]|nr:cell envelope integrity protein TolA [Deltaproteobacteria bacterium]
MTGGPLSEGLDRDPGKNWGWMLAVSLVLHALLFLLFLNIIPQGPGLRPLGPAYEVNLVSLNEGPAQVPAAGRDKAAASAPPAAPAPPVKAKPAAIPKPVAIPKPPPPLEKKITPVPQESKSLDKALELLKKKVSEEKNLERSFHQLENKVKNQEMLDQALTRLEKKSPGSGKARSGPPGSGEGSEGAIIAGSPTGSPGVGLQFQLYHASLRARIKKNWVLPEGLLKKTDLSADLLVRIARNGKIEDYRFERKSGVASFDQEVIRTLQKSDPLPPLPEGYPREFTKWSLPFIPTIWGGTDEPTQGL